MHDNYERVEVTIGDGLVVLHRIGYSSPVIAKILGTENGKDGEIAVIYLDRIVHKPRQQEFIGWSVSGAVATEMRKLQ